MPQGADELRFAGLTTKGLLRSAAFTKGFQEARNGLPFKYDAYCERDEKAYASGRQFAQCFIGPIKVEGRVTVEAEAMFNRLVRADIIL